MVTHVNRPFLANPQFLILATPICPSVCLSVQLSRTAVLCKMPPLCCTITNFIDNDDDENNFDDERTVYR